MPLPFNTIKSTLKQPLTLDKNPQEEQPLRQNPNRVRDHLANERTYLAWIRTAIAMMGFGVVIARLRLLQPPIVPTPGNGWKLGLVFSLVGLITVLLSTQHYFAVRYNIDQDTYQPAQARIIIFSLSIMLLGVGIIYYIFTVPLNPLSGVVFE